MTINNAKDLVKFLEMNKYDINYHNDKAIIKIKSGRMSIDLNNNFFEVDGVLYDRKTVFDLSVKENHSTVMLLLKLFKQGYSPINITLEKRYLVGRDYKYLDVLIKNPETEELYMIEVKTSNEYLKYTNPNNEKNVKQLFSYAMQDKGTILTSFYSYDFNEKKDLLSSVFSKDLIELSTNVDDFFDRWNKKFDNELYYFSQNPYGIEKTIKQYESLEAISENDTKLLYLQFLTILRLNSISDKPNAFIKMINLFLSKIADEIKQNSSFSYQIENNSVLSCNGLRFQYIIGETPESFMKRLNSLYKEGMSTYLNMHVIDYSDKEIKEAIGNQYIPELYKMFDDLRLKKNNEFAFIEVHDEKTFQENTEIVKQIVSLLENFKFKYETKHQFLGDFFEDLLNTSLKQEAGQFFTPYPLVDFMIESLDVEERIKNKIENGDKNFIPRIIDYACGAGHFLVAGMSKIQKTLIKFTGKTSTQQKEINAIKQNPYSWATGDVVVGIEKDYRLAKTTKIATFLNGDGDAQIISGDGINMFNCEEYKNTILYSEKNKIEKFDYLVSNPPYSVEGFMLNFRKNGIDKYSNTFSLLDDTLNFKDTAIEIYFVERMEQLLKNGGVGAIVLPQSILSQDKYRKLRRFMLNNFQIKVMLLTADITFSGTTTSPVTLILEKKKITDLDYDIMVIASPKYSTPNGTKLKTKEENFLGYKFSTNRSKSGMQLIKNSILEKITKYSHEFVIDKLNEIPDEYKNFAKIINIQNIILNKSIDNIGDIYPKRVIVNGAPLNKYCAINSWTKEDFEELPIKYLEISNLSNQVGEKNISTTRYCKKGDILISSLTPRKSQIVIAKEDAMLTSAIHVLTFKDEKNRDYVYNRLRSEDVLSQMNALLDGFKATYAKISEKNLIDNIII